jgi:Skp family chaperone for outer membrane proteins
MRIQLFNGRIAAAGLLCLFLLAATGGMARAEQKIGVVDSQRIFAEYDKAREAENVFQEEMRAWASELEGMETALIGLQEQIRTQSLLLSQEKLDDLQRTLDQRRAAYETRREEILDPQSGLAVARNEELVRPINEQVSTVVERIGAEGDYAIILDIATVNAFYFDEAIDLTDEILEGLASAEN